MKKILAAVLSLLLLCGCGAKQTAYEATFFAMDTVMGLRIFASNDATALAGEISGEIQELEQLLSVTKEDSEVARLNDGQAVALSPAVRTLLDGALALRERTEGLLDPTIYPAVKLWGFTTGDYRIPTQAEREDALRHTGLAQLHDDGDTLTLADGAALDFGSVAKGYAAERSARILTQAGVSGILTLGGNVQTVGDKPDGSAWRVGITDPANTAQSIAILSLTGSHAVVTSGDYQRYFEQDGIRYCHIIDPRTGAPARSGLRSVTIVADSGLLADGLSTVLFVMGLEEAEAFWKASADFEMILITDDGTVYVTQALLPAFSGECTPQVIYR